MVILLVSELNATIITNCLCLENLNEIKYTAYRTAMKLRAIQKLTHCKNIMCEIYYHIARLMK